MPISGMSCYGSFCINIILQRQSRRKEQTMSMTSITLICRPTKDPELRTSPSGVTFTNLDFAVTKGYGDKEHPNFFRAFCKNEMAQRVINAGVKKGSLIYITGDLDTSGNINRNRNVRIDVIDSTANGDNIHLHINDDYVLPNPSSYFL